MREMNKIVVEGYPVKNLPDDVRQRLSSTDAITVTRTVEPEAATPSRSSRKLSELYGCANGLYATEGTDPVDYVRQLRDEWE